MVKGPLKISRWLLLAIALLGVFFIVRLGLGKATAAAGINQQINFQGRLLNAQGATVPDGNYNIEFKVYQDGDGQSAGDSTGSPAGSLKWTEDHLNNSSQGVTVKNGYFSVQLGSITAFGSNINWNQDTLWLSINIGGTGSTCTPFSTCSPDGEMLPMKRLSSSPYALNSYQLGGLTSSQFIQLAQGVQTDASTSTSSIFINKTGTGNLVQLQAGGNDAFILTNTGDISFGANANHSISVAAAGAGVAGKSLTLSAGAAGTGASTLAGGDLVLQGGAGGGTNGNGGNVTIDAGAKNGTGANGNISIGTNTANSITIGKSGVTTAIAGTLNASSGPIQLGGTTIVDTSRNLTNIGTISSGQINSQTISNTANFTGTLSVQGGTLTLGNAGVNNGSLKLSNSTSGRMVILQGLNPTGSGDATIQLPSIAGGSTDTICLLTANNCNTVTTTSGTQNYLTKYNNAGATQLTKSQIFDNGTGVSVGGSSPAGLFNVGATNQFQVSSTGAITAVGLDSGTGLIQGTGGLSITGSITFGTLNTPGVLHVSNTGAVSSSAVVLGTETSGNYVASLGALTGLTTTGNSGAGATPTLSVAYGSAASTAVQGNTTLTCAAGSGNLAGGGTSITLGTGGSCASIDTVSNPTFSGQVTASNSSGIALAVSGTPTASLTQALLRLGGSLSNANNVANGGTYIGLNAPGLGAGTAADFLNFQWNGNQKLLVTNTGAVTEAGALTVQAGGITVSAGGIAVTGNSTIAGALGSLTGLTSSGSITFSGLSTAGIVHNSAAGLLSTGGVALGTDTTGNYIAQIASVTGLTVGGTNNVASAAPTLSVNYGSAASTAVQGNTTLTCASGTGNLTGGGNTITLGTGGNCNTINTVTNPTFSGLVTANGGLAIGSGQLFTNNGSTLNSAVAIADLPTGGNIGTAAATVDVATYFTLNQTTAGQTITIPSPTSATAGRVIYVSNIGTASFTLLSSLINTGSTATLVWNGTAWTFAGADGSSILNQNGIDQTGNFRISGTGRANTSFTSPLFDSISGGLNLGTATATSITLGSTANTTGITLQSGTSGVLVKGTNTTTAMQVQTSLAASVFDVDTSNQRVGIGTSAPGNKLDIQGAANDYINISSGSLSQATGLLFGRTSVDGSLTVAGGANQFLTGSVAGDTVLRANSGNLLLGSNSGTAKAVTVRSAVNSATVFQVQDASGAGILVVDSTNRQLKVMENGGTTHYALVYYDTATSTANYTADSGTVAVGTGSGAISITSGASSAVSITANAASTWKTNTGTLTLQSGSSSDLILNPGSNIVSVNGSSVVKLGSSAGDPATCTLGAIVYNSTTNLFRGCQGSTPAWATLSSTTQTLQQAYTAGIGGSTPEVKVDSTRGGLDIQDADTTINGVLFAVRASNAGGLGTSLFNVNSSNSTVNIGTSATSTALLVLGSDSDSTFNGGNASNTATVVNGAMFYSSTDHNFMCGVAGRWISCNGLLYSNTAASTAINTCTTACAAFDTANSSSVPANYCQAGRVIRLSAKGIYSTAASTTLQFGVYYGSDGTNRANDTLIGTASGAMSSGAAVTNQGWGVDFNIVCWSTTSMNGQGMATMATSSTATNTSLMYNNGATTGLTTTSAKNFYIFPTWGASAAGNTLTAQQYIISGQ